jgi:hypothetical protein
LVTPAGQHLAEDLLGAAAAAVGLGRVEQRHARVDGSVRDRPGALGIEPAPEVIAAQSHDGHDQTRVPQRLVTHDPAFRRGM